VLTRLAARIRRLPRAGCRYTVVGRRMADHGRTSTNGTALFDATGEPIAWATALWTVVSTTSTAGGRDSPAWEGRSS
jgi:hypothetical protein